METWDKAINRYKMRKIKNYREGFRNGWLDMSNGHVSEIALNCHSLEGYSTGYYDGQRERVNQRGK